MATKVQIDFDNTYEISPVSDDLKIITFETEIEGGKSVLLYFKRHSLVHFPCRRIGTLG
jgi:hypothetical protein